ncbi:polysaccharide deacetylase family protein [Bacillus sp. REN16]|uniref:polysaccharide deacetylase family protein n=1 Tax=Bacillus sp. REN16 TaxID=2887296 RepID=UPI001E4E4DCA|nr:polysaccharide deacetylase family protein [Bacillus sp. REN16]MCC3357745.1 polysaccharide deacetylase family protein [Bacillus sp. REN16]
MKRKLIGSVLVFLILFLMIFSTYKLMNSRSFQLFGGLTQQVETDQKVVALTFDDGPTGNVNEILPLLEKHDVKATFFLIGKDIEKYPEEAKKIVEAGHQVGNHTYSHNRMISKSPSFIKEEIEKTDRLIREAGYEGEIDFRPPNGKKLVGLPYYLNKQNKDTITWNIEPETYYSSTQDRVKYVKESIEPGSIILMHPMYDDIEKVLAEIEGIIQVLIEEGYSFVTVNELQDM